VEIANRDVQKKLFELLTKDYMNKLGEESLLVIRTVGTTRHYNQRVFDHVMQRVGGGPQEREVFERGTSGAGFMRFLLSDIVIRDPLRSLGPVFLKELEQWASIGVTTWSSVITPTNALSVFSELDRQGALPIRFAYTHGQGIVAFEDGAGFYRRYGDIAGHGTPYFWNIGISTSAFDSSWPRMCVSLKPRKPGFRQQCDAEPGDHRRKVLEAAMAARLRLGGNHAEGDLAVDHALDAIETGSKAGGLSPDEIRAKRHVIDHCAFNPRPDQIKRSVALGIIWSCGPRYIDERSSLVADMFGEEYAHNWVVPARSVLKAGGKLVYESDDGELIKRGPFYQLERFVTRKDAKGRVWGAHEALDRRTALLTATRWAAGYVLREDVIGSIEAGKWADIVILDGDFLAVADQELSKLRVDATLVGGKLVYASDAFALRNRMSPRVREIDLLNRKELLEGR
jgi:predicted amidohydrolase YtcJ